MIGVFDSGHGGLTVLSALAQRFPDQNFIYLGDHANAPYGNRPADEVIDLTRDAVVELFGLGCRLVILACNTATAVACRRLQHDWLPTAGWDGHNVLGIVAPTVEAATQMPWAQQTPIYPQKYNRDVIVLFGTRRTIASGVYSEEIRKRCPLMEVIGQPCPSLVDAIEGHETALQLEERIQGYVNAALDQLAGRSPDTVILGCTHYPLVQPIFEHFLPRSTRLLAQPEAVAHSLEDYLVRRPQFCGPKADDGEAQTRLLTTGAPAAVASSLGAALEELMPCGAHFVHHPIGGQGS
ncbi:MAG: aspartate/glutamate racemase family protein [Pseudomonadota bacterium]